ncbi:hypothetical protein Q9L58_001086 [Maublancomyces gigas]|uniref:Uncharacterized protein n=1 Tax=Discina gigas TaxID=1032678 RepID=A0ABR3GUZ5_9PEZI
MSDGVCLLAQVLKWPVSVLILLLEDKGCRDKQVSGGISLSAESVSPEPPDPVKWLEYMEVILATTNKRFCALKNQLEKIESDLALLQDGFRNLCVEAEMILEFSGLELEFSGLELDE